MSLGDKIPNTLVSRRDGWMWRQWVGFGETHLFNSCNKSPATGPLGEEKISQTSELILWLLVGVSQVPL